MHFSRINVFGQPPRAGRPDLWQGTLCGHDLWQAKWILGVSGKVECGSDLVPQSPSGVGNCGTWDP